MSVKVAATKSALEVLKEKGEELKDWVEVYRRINEEIAIGYRCEKIELIDETFKGLKRDLIIMASEFE